MRPRMVGVGDRSRAHAGERGRGAAERRKRVEGTRRGRAERVMRTRRPERARGGRYAGAWAVRGARAETPCTWTLCAWFVRCSQLRAPGSLSGNSVFGILSISRYVYRVCVYPRTNVLCTPSTLSAVHRCPSGLRGWPQEPMLQSSQVRILSCAPSMDARVV